MDSTGTFRMADSISKFNAITCLHKHYEINDWGHRIIDVNYTWYSMGIKEEEVSKLSDFIDKFNMIPNICIDVANGYTDDFVNFCRKVRDKFGNVPIIMAGNVCTPEMVQELILHGGVDIVKIGIGPGSACTTRLKTGVGYPQLSAILECAHAAHGLTNKSGNGGLICADGGCRVPADVVKAFAAGADFVMIGGMFAGTDECEGVREFGGFKFYGMSSHEAQKKHGGIRDYTASEGRVINVPHKGPAENIMTDILGGIRSACAYVGANSLEALPKCAEFTVVNRVHFNNKL